MIIEGLLTLEQLKILEENLNVIGFYGCYRQAQEEATEFATAISHSLRADKADPDELLEEFSDLLICMTQVLMQLYKIGLPKGELLKYIQNGIEKTQFKTNRRKEQDANTQAE